MAFVTCGTYGDQPSVPVSMRNVFVLMYRESEYTHFW